MAAPLKWRSMWWSTPPARGVTSSPSVPVPHHSGCARCAAPRASCRLDGGRAVAVGDGRRRAVLLRAGGRRLAVVAGRRDAERADRRHRRDGGLSPGRWRCSTKRPRSTSVTFAQSWAGLRTFAPDRLPVIGWDPDAPRFCWLVGQGGAGIKTSPALAGAVAAIVGGTPWPPELAALGVLAEDLAPQRFRSGRRPPARRP